MAENTVDETGWSADLGVHRRTILRGIVGGLVTGTGVATAATGDDRSFSPEGSDPDPVDYVNPLWGTDIFSESEPALFDVFWRGNTVPGPSRPFGMVKLSPDTSPTGAASTYYWRDDYIEGFSHTHLNGGGSARYGNILMTPATGAVQTTEADYRSSFDHGAEEARPGYYSVPLEDHGTEAELTTTKRAGFHRYTFPESSDSHILLDVTHSPRQSEGGSTSPFIAAYDPPPEGSVTILPEETAVEGELTVTEKKSGGEATYTIYFYAKFDTAFDGYGTWDDSRTGDGKQRGSTHVTSEDCGAFFEFATTEDQEILAKVGISYVSTQEAKTNLTTELPHWDFDRVVAESRDIWNDELRRIEVEGGTEDQRIIFYTALYHTLLHPDVFSDVSGTYIGMDDEVRTAEEYTKYAVFDTWGQFRFLFPLHAILVPDRHRDMLESYIEYYDTLGWIPKWPLLNTITNTMIGDHGAPSIIGSYLKGVRDIDIETAYEGLRKSAMQPATGEEYEGREGLRLYKNLGYVPLGGHEAQEVVGKQDEATTKDQSVSKTIEFAYDDWTLAKLAHKLGREGDYELFMARAMNYENVFDAENTGWMRPKDITGNWRRPFDPKDKIGFVEANSWMTSWFVPHSIAGVINGMGGKGVVSDRLDHFFSGYTISPPSARHIVQDAPEDANYWHGNQPDQQAPYLYNYIGQPWKTQEVVRWAMETQHGTGPGGISGNEDMGATSAWYVLSAMGFIQANPASTHYEIGSPIFEKVTLHLDEDYYGGDTFVIEAHQASADNKYVQSATLNGERLEKPWFSHFELLGGGRLEFEMGPEPNRDWASDVYDAPPLYPDIPTLLVAPGSFDPDPGESRTLLARLTDGSDDPIANQEISWYATDGDIEPSTTTTGGDGTVVVEYTAPKGGSDDTFADTITAWFPGSPEYHGNYTEAEVGTPATPGSFSVSGSREDGADVFTGGQTNRVEITLDPSRDALPRDTIPEEWSVVDNAGDVARVEHDAEAGVRQVYFTPTAPAEGLSEYTYFAEAPSDPGNSGVYQMGPVEASPVDGGDWTVAEGTTDTHVVVGRSTNI